MKILRLDLLAFGAFSQYSLPLDQGQHGLHLVYGPNEAGKSTALRALRQFLYGIPHNSSDNFIHAHPKLRIGGLVESAGGERLECIRRKARGKTLRGADDVAVVNEARLAGMLGGVDGMTFGQRFGIDYEELRKGGEAVVNGGGDLGNILFAAGAGMADLREVQKKLEEEADALFKPRGQNPRINSGISEWNAARRTIKESLLLTSSWVECDRELAEATRRREQIQQQLQEKRARKSQLERIAKALPLLARRERLERDRNPLADVPLLPDDFSGTRREALTQLGHARDTQREATKAMEELRAKMDELQVPLDLLRHRTAIDELQTQRGSILKAGRDRPDLVAKREAAHEQARQILHELGREPELREAEGLRLSVAQRKRIQSLAEDCKARLDQDRAARGHARKLRERLQRLETQRKELAADRDVSDLQQAVRRIQKSGDLDQQQSELRAELERLEKQVEIDRTKLPLFQGTLEELERLAVPALETMERFENQWSDAQADVERVEERIEESRREAQELTHDLDELQREGDIPTEEDLTHARRRRDEGWQLLRDVQRGALSADDDSPREFVSEFAPDNGLEQAFFASLEMADRIVDRLRGEADRVAEKTRLIADQRKLERKLADLEEQRRRAAEMNDKLREEWIALWAPLGLHPLSPREMRAWRHQQQALADLAAALRQQRSAVQRLKTQRETCCEELRQRLEELEHPLDRRETRLAELLECCEGVVRAADEANRQRQRLDDQLAKGREELADAEREAEEAQAALEQWRGEWSAAVAQLGLDQDAQPSEAHTVLDLIQELSSQLTQARELDGRIEGMDRDAEQFAHAVKRVLTQVADDLLEVPADEAVVSLYDRLQIASRHQTKLEEWQQQLEREETRLKKARSEASRFEAALKTLCEQAGCDSPDALPDVERRSARRRELENELKSVHEQLDGLTGGGALPELVAEAERFDQDDLQAQVQQLEDEIQRLALENDEINERIGSCRKELEKMDGSGQAAEAQEQAQSLLASIQSDVEQYVRLRLASAVLRRSIERFREASQGPVMARASQLFAALTLGSFSGIRANYDEKGAAVLEGVRAGSQQGVQVGGMSDGTCDQLYLALRLALLESSLDGSEPLPFIIDDILIMFDDQRAAAALRILGELSHKTQVVFFTHHQHLVDLARQTLEEDVLYVHHLEQEQPAA